MRDAALAARRQANDPTVPDGIYLRPCARQPALSIIPEWDMPDHRAGGMCRI